MAAVGLNNRSEGGKGDEQRVLGIEADGERAARLRPLVEQFHSLTPEDFLWVVLTLIKERGGTPPITSTGFAHDSAVPAYGRTDPRPVQTGTVPLTSPVLEWAGAADLEQPAPRDADGDERGAGNHLTT